GRDPADVTLIAVSKTKPVDMMRTFYALGQRDFGENHVQELVAKEAVFPEANYHMIGHLQTNKVKQVVGKTVLIHSVDSVHLAEAVSKESVKKGLTSAILLEINAGNEASKYGFSFEEAKEAAAVIAGLPNLKICGLMCVAPFVADPEENRAVFRKMRDLSVDIGAQNSDNITMNILSMGMSNDYAVAVEEGATHVRVGTALFGERDYGGLQK
ncbi:MAG: YggS family pyridoxal phosphate-dependent enzyme, partial [Lachnospiraceae bacterium]|nr:YggS family pyridoxal phosphate-dependent enzyme [Lachnospiraceae bacterium]